MLHTLFETKLLMSTMSETKLLTFQTQAHSPPYPLYLWLKMKHILHHLHHLQLVLQLKCYEMKHIFHRVPSYLQLKHYETPSTIFAEFYVRNIYTLLNV